MGGRRDSSELTDWLGNRHDLRTVKGQITEGPDDGVNLLHYVEGDGDDAAGVLAHGHTPGGKDRESEVKHRKGLQPTKALLATILTDTWSINVEQHYVVVMAD